MWSSHAQYYVTNNSFEENLNKKKETNKKKHLETCVAAEIRASFETMR